MTRSFLGRALVGAALVALMSTFTTATASAEPIPVPDPVVATTITWTGDIADAASFDYGKVPAAPTCQLAVAGDCVVTGYDQKVGVHTLTVTATSAAGPVVETRSYTVVATWVLKGFYKPVKMTAVNKVKAGSTVPFKFKIYTGDPKQKGTKKLTKTSKVESFLAQQVTCDAAATPIGDAKSVAGKSKGMKLRYRDGAYHQNWKTPKLVKPAKDKGVKTAATPICFQVTMTAIDGQSLKASFWLK